LFLDKQGAFRQRGGQAYHRHEGVFVYTELVEVIGWRMVRILLFLIIVATPSLASAQARLDEQQARQVIINEIAWMGTPVEGIDARQHWRQEWIELFNSGEQVVSLQGWRIELYSGENLDFTIVLFGNVLPNGYFLIGASDKIPGVDVNYASLAGKLKNPGQRVVLKDAAGNVVEEMNASSGWFAGDNDSKLTMERRFPDRDPDPENWGSSRNTGGTPKTENSIFGKERVLALGQSSLTDSTGTLVTKKDQPWSSLTLVLSNTVFRRAFLVALAFAALLVYLRRYLVYPE